MIVAYIDQFRDRFGVEPICSVLTEHDLPIASSTYRAAKAAPVTEAMWDEAHLVNALVSIFVSNRRLYGVRKLWRMMLRAGHQIGRDQVARLMRIASIHGVVRGRHTIRTTERDEKAPRHPDLVGRRWSEPTGPDQLWVADFTYVWTLAGFCYVAFVTDVYSRRILGWRASMNKTTDLVHAALQQALFVRRRADSAFTATGLIHHSDAGSQYTSLAFTQSLIEAGIAGSIGTVGDALDNALMESTIGLFKTELIHPYEHTFTGRNEVERETADWVHWYNTDRIHSSIDYNSPREFEQRYREAAAIPAVA